MSEPGYRLITAGPSPYGRKVAVALAEKNLAFETVYDLPWADALETRKYSPLEQLPILLPAEGEPVYDSALILDWLELVHPEPPLVPAAQAARIDCLRRRTLGERLMEVAQALVFEMYRDAPAEQTVDRLTRKIVRGLEALEDLVDARCASALACDLGDIASVTTLSCWEYIVNQGISPAISAFEWRGRHPALTKLVEQMETRASFEATRPVPMQVDIRKEVSA